MSERTNREEKDAAPPTKPSTSRKWRYSSRKRDLSLQTPVSDLDWNKELAYTAEAQPATDASKELPRKLDVQIQTDRIRKRKPEENPLPAATVDSNNVADNKDYDVKDKDKDKEKPPKDSSSSLSISSRPRSRTSESDIYDREEALTTKVLKKYKKRPPKPSVIFDSDESITKLPVTTENHQIEGTTEPDAESQTPRSDAPTSLQHQYYFDSDTLIFSSSTPLVFDSGSGSRSPDQLPPGRGLIEGYQFIYMVRPPDGGYGWFIVLISFLAQMIVDGMIFTVGTLLPYIGETFDASSGAVIMVASVQIGFYFLAGAVASAFINSYGFRPVALCGVAAAIVTLLISSFSTSLAMLIIFYSVIGGPCLSMVWASSQLIIGYYFERKRPIANGMSVSGAGAGLIFFAMVNSYLLTAIGWKCTIRVHVLFLLIVFVLVLFYIEVPPRAVAVIHTQELSISRTSSDEYYGDYAVHNFMQKSSHIFAQYHPSKKPKSICPNCKYCLCCCRRKSELRDSDDTEVKYLIHEDLIQREDLYYTGPVEYGEPKSKETVDGQEIKLVGSTKNMQSTAYGLTHRRELSEIVIQNKRSLAQLKAEKAKHPVLVFISPKNWLHPKIRKAFKLLFDFRLFKRYDFRLLILSAFLYPIGFNIPFVYTKQRTSIPPELSSWIGPTIGLSNFLSRIACGFIAYRYKNSAPTICGGGLVFGGMMVFISAFYGSNLVWFQFLYGFCFGVAPAVFATLRGIIYVRYLGLSNLTNVFGLTALAMGIGVFIGTTIGGLLVEITGKHMFAFAFGGICIMSSGIVKLMLPIMLKRR